MRIQIIGKRYYTNKDLLKDKFGRLYHLPFQFSNFNNLVKVDAIDYRNFEIKKIKINKIIFETLPLHVLNLLFFPFLIKQRISKYKPDVVIASGDSHIGFFSMLICKKMDIPFVFDVYDFYPSFKGNAMPGMKKMFEYTVKKADFVLCASESLVRFVHPLNKNKMLVENGVDDTIFFPMDQWLARKKLGMEKKETLIGYFGSIDNSRGPILIEACRILRKEYSSLEIVLAGKVREVNIVEPWINYFGELPQSQIPLFINACDIVTVPYKNTPFNNMSGACKISEYLACGKPIVATKVSDHEQIFANNLGSVCEPRVDSMVNSLKKQIKNPEIVPFDKSKTWNEIGIKTYEQLKKMLTLEK